MTPCPKSSWTPPTQPNSLRCCSSSASQWLARDPARLGGSLAQFVGHPAYGLAQLRGDLQRFVFLLGGSDGEALFGPGTAQ